MPIQRTSIQDDDGSGKTGTVIDNAWKQQFYDQIDAMTAALVLPTMGTFTAVDISGGLGNLGPGTYMRVGRVYTIFVSLSFPVNANGANVSIGGFPFVQSNTIYGALYQGYGPTHYRTYFVTGTNVMTIIDGVNGTARTNGQLSGQGMHFHGVILTD